MRQPPVSEMPEARPSTGIGAGVLGLIALFGAVAWLASLASPGATPAPRRAASPTSAAADRENLLEKLRLFDRSGQWFVGVERGYTEDDARVTVTDHWHSQPYRQRLQVTEAVWQMWAVIHSPQDRDHSLLSLVDGMGNSVGGSSGFGGSLIDVER